MTSMMEALSKVGFCVNKDSYIEYEKFSDIKLPFGNTVNRKDSPIMTEFDHEQLDGLNYIRRTAEAVTAERIVELCPCIDKDNKYINWLVENADRVMVINKGSYHENKSTGYLGRYTNPDCRSFKADTEFGLADVVCMFQFNTQRMTIEPKFSKSTLSYEYQRDLISEADRVFGEGYNYDITGDDAFELIKHFADRMEFIPLYIIDWDGVVISHKKYKNKYGFIVDEVTSPCLGVNIKKHDKVMKGLTDFIEGGGYIKDDVFYLIHQSKGAPDGTYYLRRYEEWSPRLKKVV